MKPDAAAFVLEELLDSSYILHYIVPISCCCGRKTQSATNLKPKLSFLSISIIFYQRHHTSYWLVLVLEAPVLSSYCLIKCIVVVVVVEDIFCLTTKFCSVHVQCTKFISFEDHMRREKH